MVGALKGHDEALGRLAPGGIWPDSTQPLIRMLLHHWAEGRHGGLVPHRAAIDPARIAAALPHIWLYRYDAARGDFLCTLAGEAIRGAWGQPIMHRYMAEFMPAAVQDLVCARLRQILEMPALMHSIGPADSPGGQYKLANRLVLPLLDADCQRSIVMGLSVYEYARTDVNLPVGTNHDVIFYACAGLPREAPPL